MPASGPEKKGVSAISDRAIAAAKKPGHFIAVKELFSGVGRSNFRLELLDLLLFHLQPQWMEPPPLDYGNARERMERATSLVRVASFCVSLGMSSVIVHSSEHLHGRIAQTILDHFDDIKSWIARLTPGRPSSAPSHLLSPDGDPIHHCMALVYMQQLDLHDGPLSSEIKKSREITEFALAAWVAIEPLRGRAYLNTAPDELCPTMQLLYFLLFREETRHSVIAVLYSQGKRFRDLRARIVEATISRCRTLTGVDRSSFEQKLAILIAKGELEPPRSGRLSMVEIVFTHMEAIARVVQGLSEHPDMRNAFRKSVFFEEYTRVLHVWLVEKSDRKRDRTERFIAFQLLSIVSCLVECWPSTAHDISASTSRYQKAVAASSLHVVRGGFAPALIECLCSVTMEDQEPLDYISESLKWLRNACNQDPALSQLVYSELVAILGESFWRAKLAVLGRQNEHLLDMGLDLAAWNVFPNENQPFPCDNLQCENDGTATTFRVCSGCEAVAYCSRKCQEVDWKALHRKECCFAEEDFLKNPSKAPYRQSLRKRQALILARRALIELSEDEALQDEVDTSPCVLFLNGIPDRVTIYSLKEYMEWRRNARIGLEGAPQTPHYLDQRIHNLLELYDNGEWEEGQYLVSATYQVGRRRALLLVMMRMPESTESEESEEKSDDVRGYGESCTVSYCIAEFVSSNL